MRYRDQLRAEMSEVPNFPEELLSILPSGYFEMDRKVVIKLKPPLEPFKEIIAEKTAAIIPRAKGIWQRTGQIKGKYRQPQGLLHLWGDPNPDVIVRENGVYYSFNFTKVMFAKGNVHERGLLPKKIQEGELIVDMFSGIGYFSLGMAKSRKPTKIYSIEWNPDAFEYLQRNIKKNHVEDIITPIHGDCKEEVKKLADQGIKAHRIIMGLLPAPVDAIEPALSLVRESGTIVVYEGVEREDSTVLYDEFVAIAIQHNFQCELLERRLVKAFKPHEYHVVLEILVKPKTA